MKKNLIFSALSICTFMLFSCGNKNKYVITNKNNIEFDIGETHYKTFGYQNLNIKKGTTYTFVYDFSSAPLEYVMDTSEPDPYIFNAFVFGFNLDLNNCSAKLNDSSLKIVEENYKGVDYDVKFGEITEISSYGLAINSDRVKLKNNDKLTFVLKANEDVNNITACGSYLD